MTHFIATLCQVTGAANRKQLKKVLKKRDASYSELVQRLERVRETLPPWPNAAAWCTAPSVVANRNHEVKNAVLCVHERGDRT